MRYLLLLAALLVNTAWGNDKLYNQCAKDAVSSSEIGKCGAEQLEREDALLNRVWREVYRPLPPGKGKTALLNEQRRWIPFKDSSCLYWLDDFGTAGRDIYFFTCREAVIKYRTYGIHDMFHPRNAPIALNDTLVECEHTSVCISEAEYLIKEASYNRELGRVANEIYINLTQERKENARKTLFDEQQLWDAFKESACQQYRDKSSNFYCKLELLDARIRYLKEIIAFQETGIYERSTSRRDEEEW